MTISTNSAPTPQIEELHPDMSRTAQDRSAAIRDYRILDTMPEENFDNITTLAATIFGTAFAAISFIDDRRAWVKSEVGLGIGSTPLSQSFCAHTIAHNDLMVVEDATHDPRFTANSFVTGEPLLRFYAGMPIRTPEGMPIAALCVVDPTPRAGGMTGMERMTLKVLAKQVETQLELRRAIITRDEQAIEERAMSDALRFLAEHDALTGLPNRTVFNEKLAALADRNGTGGGRAAVMLIDVDHFKQVNDAFGHDAGDALLCDFGNRLRQCLRAGDTVARLGGDEFGTILYAVDDAETVDSVCRSLEERLREPMTYEGRLIDCRASIGIAIYPDHADTAADLVKCADLALAAAKAQRGSIVMFEKSLSDEFERDITLFAEARTALANDTVAVGYQPKIDLKSGLLTGFEALVRVRTSTGLGSDAKMFARAFHDRELAVAISERMLSNVLDDMKSWSDRGIAFGHVAINSCAADYVANDFAERLLAMLAGRGLDPRLIELEVTEGVFLGRGSDHVSRALAKLSSCGVRIALDDFGTGYASLSHLKRFPIDVLKIDQAFVACVDKNPDDAAIVRALIGLGESLGMETVAEGVETNAQAAFVRSHGCTTAQGFLYGAACSAGCVPQVAMDLTRSLAA